MLGGAGAFCNTNFGEERSKISKTFENLPGHYKAMIKYDLYIFYKEGINWSDEEQVRLNIDGEEVTAHGQGDGLDDVTCGEFPSVKISVSKEFEHT